jgi:hypothetical protein
LRASGLQASSGSIAAGSQVSPVAGSPYLTFGQDPNNLIDARGGCRRNRSSWIHVARWPE